MEAKETLEEIIPAADETPKKRTFFEILNAISETLIAFEDTAEGIEGEVLFELETDVMAELDMLANQESEKVDDIAFVMKRAKNNIEALNAERDIISIRIKSAENRLDNFKQYILEVLIRNGLKKVKGNYHSMYWVERDSLVMAEMLPEPLPEKYVEKVVTLKPLRSEIKKAILAGELIKGCNVVTKKNLTVR